jgi:two-component system, OmpR family, sensor histidine kinase VicK
VCKLKNELAGIEIIQDTTDILKTYKKMLMTSISEISLVYPTVNAVFRHRRNGIFELIRERSKRSAVKVRVLLPLPEFNDEMDSEIRGQFANLIQFRALDKRVESTATFVVVDKKAALVMELRDDSKNSFSEAIGFAIFSNSIHIVSSYSSIFDTLWHQTELNEQILQQNLILQRKNEELTQLELELRQSIEALADSNKKLETANIELNNYAKIQTEFINVAAHELRTPTQSIIGYCEMIEMLPERSKEYIERLRRNADRLYTLTSDILDATKIEAGTLRMNMTHFNLTETINEVVKDMRKKTFAMHKDVDMDNMIPNIEFSENHPLFIHADKDRIIQVVSNLLDNAIKFGEDGAISIGLHRNNTENEVTVKIIDSGRGIDPEIYPRLFEKFVTKSNKGTGLGLFISKNIIHAHGGSMFGRNNSNNHGATFSFSLPMHSLS